VTIEGNQITKIAGDIALGEGAARLLRTCVPSIDRGLIATWRANGLILKSFRAQAK
jgi:hypothetical protein